MSKKNIWALLDVSEDARKNAKKRAKLEGKPIGKWITDLILSGQTSGQIVMSKTYTSSNADPIINDNISKEVYEIKLGMKVIYDELNKLQQSIIQLNYERHLTPKRKFFSKFFG